jgi:deazaflavin-dependent oxidoreductase (nitroreductase family)
MTPSPDAEAPTTVLARWLRPQDYSADARYRAPARLYGKLSRWIGVPLTSLGLAPRYAVTLEVPGRRSGRPRRNPVLVTTFDDVEYLVSLAGESEWVRNVRAADGRAVLHRRGVRAVRLLELPPASRAPVLAAYQAAGAARSGEAAARLQARYNFGLGPAPTLADFECIAARYPVFRVEDRTRRSDPCARIWPMTVRSKGRIGRGLGLYARLAGSRLSWCAWRRVRAHDGRQG